MEYQLYGADGCDTVLHDGNVEFWLTEGSGFFYSATKLEDSPIAARSGLTPSTSIIARDLPAGDYKISVLAANTIDVEYNIMAYSSE